MMVFGLVLSAQFAFSQRWNPYVSGGSVTPDPMIPVEFKGTGRLSFTVGNQGEDPLHLVKNQEMTMVITLSNGLPAHEDPVAAIGGSWAEYFNWTFDPEYRSYFALQNRDIPGYSSGEITIGYRVTVNTQSVNPANGFNVNLQPPPYSNGINSTADDALSFYTFVRALDYGDAPSDYGSAVHEINIFRNPETGEYENYMYLGSVVDPEPGDQFSSNADGDDLNGIDDEDGVIIPILYQGDTLTIPVTVTVHDHASGALNAWFDWNGDGNFSGTGEKVQETPVHVFESGTIGLKIMVPDSAITSRQTFARFRLGANDGPQGYNPWGEVEDYAVIIKPKSEKEENQPVEVED